MSINSKDKPPQVTKIKRKLSNETRVPDAPKLLSSTSAETTLTPDNIQKVIYKIRQQLH
ncbi:unnamed protein product, partial [Didymodactylos carnosus]